MRNPQAPTTTLLLRVEEAAEALSLGRSTVYELIRDGELPVVKIGRATRIPVQAVEAWVESNTADAQGERHEQQMNEGPAGSWLTDRAPTGKENGR